MRTALLLCLAVSLAGCDKSSTAKEDATNERIARLEKELDALKLDARKRKADAKAPTEHAEKGNKQEPEKPKKMPLGKPVATVGASEFATAYRQNAVAADAKYKGKTVDLSADIFSITQEPNSGRYFVQMALLHVRCFIDPDHKRGFEGVKAGDTITVRGRCVGKNASLGADLEDCILVSAKKALDGPREERPAKKAEKKE